MANFEWFESKVSDLSSDVERLHVLSELKLAVSSHNASQQKYLAQNLHLDIVFDCLNSSEREEIHAACHILCSLLACLDSNVVLRQYGANLKRALSHPSPTVKEMAIAELRRAASSSELIQQLTQNDLLLNVVACLKNEDIAVAKNASALLIKLGESEAGRRILFSSQIIQGLQNIRKESDILRYRVYELVVYVAEHSSEGLQACVSSDLLPSLVKELQTKDVLVQLNALEMLTKLALKPHGSQYLEVEGVMRHLAERVTMIEEEPLGSLLLPGLIKFFGNMAQSNPKEFFREYPSMVIALFETFDTTDNILLGVAMETVGYIATSVEGKYMLHNAGEPMNRAMKKLNECITCSPTDTRVRALNTVANIIELKLDDQDTQALALTKELFYKLSSDPINSLMMVCQQPFPELRLASLQILKVLAEQDWGQQCIQSSAGITELLLDRSIESNKSCKDAKFEVVKTLADSPTAASVFSTEMLVRLKEFVGEGPFFVQTQTEVAIEGAR